MTKKIEAFIREEKFEDVKNALYEIGIFGMNVVGVPGVQDGSEMAFWWVMLGMAAVSGLILLLLRLRRLF